MGMDISVECRAWHLDEEGGNAGWQAAIDLYFLNITRNYDAFECLFGMRNYANFRPLAAKRGMPSDASETVRAELAQLAPWPDQAYGVTWITWAELKVVDWDESVEWADSRIHRYRQTADGLRFIGKSAWDFPVHASRRLARGRCPARRRSGPRGANGSSATPSTGPKGCVVGTLSRRTVTGSRCGPSWRPLPRGTVTRTCGSSSGSTTEWARSVVGREVVEAVVGGAEGLVHQALEVSVPQCVDDPAAVLAGGDESGQAESGQVLAHRRAGDAAGLGEGGDVGLALTQALQEGQAGTVGHQPQDLRGHRQPLALVSHLRIIGR